jgi:hypothetical protein
MAPGKWRGGLRRAALAAATCALLLTVACWPTTRFVGNNFVVSQQTVPLWVKAVDFVDRDVNLAATARAVLGDAAGADAKAAAAFAWTRSNIRPQPAELPAVDDHIWHIIVRGYGLSDQRADVFTTLLSYGGVRAYWMLTRDARHAAALSYVWIRGEWRVYDVSHGVIFRGRGGDLATPDEIARDRDLISLAAVAAGLDAADYLARFEGYEPPVPPEVSRAEMQMPARRFWQELRRAIGVPAREWQMRPPPDRRVQRTQP